MSTLLSSLTVLMTLSVFVLQTQAGRVISRLGVKRYLLLTALLAGIAVGLLIASLL